MIKALEFLMSTMCQATFDSWRNSNNVDSYLSELHAAVPKAQLLIERAECWRLPIYKKIDENLPHLKDSVYEAQSIVLEWQFQSSKHKVEKRFPHTQIFQNWMSNFPNTVKKVLDRLNNVYNQIKEICDSLGIPENSNQFSKTARPITSTFLDTSNLYGRDKEFNDVVRLMGVPSSRSGKRKRAEIENVSSSDIGESSCKMDKKHNVSVLSILGMGGVGKTTLSQLVCNDETVKSYFDPIMWICVSEKFDLVRVTKEIIDCVSKNKYKPPTNLNEMQKDLEKKLNFKKFLLVLDDVWSKGWQHVLAPMKGALEGSVVLVTTRSPKCVEISGTGIGSEGVINLEGLEEDIYWKFFKSCAFDSVESNNINPELEDIGKEICKRLKGSPLAAITIGGALKNNSGVEHWRNIKDSKMWELQEEEHDILPVLQLSFQYLPTHLRKCFSFCSLYPKDFEFTQNELTEFWIMQGFIDPKQLRTRANSYFYDLVRRGFFQKRATHWVIHDLMHDVCLAITKDECFCLENGHSKQKVSLDIRHASVFQNNTGPVKLKELYKYKKLLSLKVCNAYELCITEMEALCNELENIRSLSLVGCNITELPENIGNLKHLQFLDISGTTVTILPESICNLYNLQYLNMMDCTQLFPEEFSNLVNLERFECIAKVIHTNYLWVHLKGNKNIEILKNFWNLSGFLCIGNLEYVPSKEAAQEAQLNNRPINRLELEWSRNCNVGDYGENSNEVLDGLCPHRNLEELFIEGYPGSCLSPSWLGEGFLPNLKEVEFHNFEASSISHLPSCITKLSFHVFSQLENLQNLLVPNHLPNLKYISLVRCDQESLSVESFGGFKSLQKLEICECPKLRSTNAMVLPPSVKRLVLEDCGDLIQSSPSFLQNLTSLETLTISRSQQLVSIPAEVTSNLKNLSKLHLENCNNLELLGGVQFLASLQEVIIQLCPKLGQNTAIRDINGKLPSEPIEEWKRSIST